jgi:uncharacterized membrane protein YidH (DUF202 family)
MKLITTNNMKTIMKWIGILLILTGYAIAILGTTESNVEVRVFSRVLVTLMTLGALFYGFPRFLDDIRKHRCGSED